MTLIRELIELPERVHRGDFVLRLSEGVMHPEETLRQYVVTPQLATSFDDALGFIKSALDSASSKATYLHGSFGSGKSHFMAVLHLLLQHNAQARSIPELASVIGKHNAWTEGKRFLLIPYHMIGAHNMESAILGHYVEHVRKAHPDAPLPGVYLAESIFADAEQLRARLGDAAFFEQLNAGSAAGGSGWGEIGAGWDGASFGAALDAPPRSEDRSRLVSDLVSRFFTAYQSVATAHGEAFVPLDDGLSIVSRHAQSLGYDAVILFLDELILWLASRSADFSFVTREGQKLAKLVEAQTADRPIPLISFVARQRDLRDLVGDHVTGAEQLSFGDVLKWWEARFHKITLEDRNLPAIAEKRVLRPRSEAARIQLDEAFRETTKVREEVMSTLLTGAANREMFRQVYPFSPALVQALVAVSSVLQRERTALKVMLQLLVSQRETLKVGDIVPVGDLFDAIAEGDEAFSEGMRIHFDNAKRLYHEKLLPLLEREHGLGHEEAASGANGKAAAFRTDDRLVKTLLLSALVPEVEALKALTPSRLAALNHGTFRSPIAGREGHLVLSKCRKWAAQVGEIKIGEGPANPTIQVQLTGVDTEGILEAAQANDNFANRQRKVRELLFEQLGIQDQDELFIRHDFVWRGTRRSCDVVYTNVRELPDESLRAQADWKVILDFPFDAEGHTPADDLAKLQKFRQTGSASTLAWLPSFFSRQSQKDLGTLVILDHVLAGERFLGYASHLSVVDRAAAKSLLENQRSQLRQKIINCLEGAYAVATPAAGSVETAHFASEVEHFQSLDPTFQPQPPVGANLRDALHHLLGQMLKHRYPAHPDFPGEVKSSVLKKVWGEVEQATQAEGGRLAIEKPLRPLLRMVANPLDLGTMHETHLVLSQRWKTHFLKEHARDGGPITVAKLREWTDRPTPMGLTKEVRNLVFLTFAAQTDRSFRLHGGPGSATIDSIPDEQELQEQELPSQADWDVARERAAAICGFAPSPLRNATNVAKLAEDLKRFASDHVGECRTLMERLKGRVEAFGLEAPAATARYKTAAASLKLLEDLASATSEEAIPHLAAAELATSAAAMATSIKKAVPASTTLEQTTWEIFDAVGRLTGDRAAAARAVRARAAEALSCDENAVALGPKLGSAQGDALKLITQTEPASPPPAPGRKVVETKDRTEMSVKDANQVFSHITSELKKDPSTRLDLAWTLTREVKQK